MNDLERKHTIDLIQRLANDLNPEKANYRTTCLGIQQHVAKLVAENKLKRTAHVELMLRPESGSEKRKK